MVTTYECKWRFLFPRLYSKGKGSPSRLPIAVFRRWSRFLAVSLQVTWVINPAVGCYYFPPGPQLLPQPLRGLLPISLLDEQRHDGCEQFALDCYPPATRLRFEPGPFCAWVQHANYSAIPSHVCIVLEVIYMYVWLQHIDTVGSTSGRKWVTKSWFHLVFVSLERDVKDFHSPADATATPSCFASINLKWILVRQFSSTTVPSVLRHCWLGVRKSIRPVEIEWWGYLPGYLPGVATPGWDGSLSPMRP